jgi:hypothetical protein
MDEHGGHSYFLGRLNWRIWVSFASPVTPDQFSILHDVPQGINCQYCDGDCPKPKFVARRVAFSVSD